MNLTTTIEEIYAHKPSRSGFAKLVVNIFGVDADPESSINEQNELLTHEQRTAPITLLQLLDSNGIHDALWALRCWNYRDHCLLLADIIEPSGKHSDCDAVRNMATTIRRWHAGNITDADLARAAAARGESAAAWASAWAAAADAADAERAARAANSEWSRIEQLMRDFCAEKGTK